ncbi:MAG: NTP transferase domain-containing protein [Alphaproteobacteria bacterium]|nr:NTP transferase domain-containing protein [Alphaproteobacteria bacterium]
MSARQGEEGRSVKFGDLTVDDAAGAILAHSLKVGTHTFRKGRMLSDDDIGALKGNGIETVVAVRLEENDLHENDAAQRLAKAIAGDNLSLSATATGRCNLVANANGLAVLNAETIDALNLTNEVIAISTVAPYRQVKKGDVVATVKIITFGISQDIIETCEKIANINGKPVSLATFTTKKIGLVQTKLPILRDSLLEKARTITRNRIAALESKFVHEVICEHNASDVSIALKECLGHGCEIALVMGASAIADRGDVIPAAVEDCSGVIEHFGLPVDPGNLMLLGKVSSMRVLGLPGSARSPRLHGFDWVLQRLVANIDVTGTDLMRMGVGGLLKDIPSRPLPRTAAVQPETMANSDRNIIAIILGAGQSRRMGSVNKLLAEIDGKPMISYVVAAAQASRADRILVVTGHEKEKLETALSNQDVDFVHNPHYAEGLSTSLSTAMGALDDDIDAAVVCLGDMPGISADHINALVEAFDPDGGKQICIPTFNGKWGNPVLWDQRFFSAMQHVSGDVGARHIIGEHQDVLHEVPIEDNAVLTDLDTPAALAAHLADIKSKD